MLLRGQEMLKRAASDGRDWRVVSERSSEAAVTTAVRDSSTGASSFVAMKPLVVSVAQETSLTPSQGPT
jgi:hypothetical protein